MLISLVQMVSKFDFASCRKHMCSSFSAALDGLQEPVYTPGSYWNRNAWTCYGNHWSLQLKSSRKSGIQSLKKLVSGGDAFRCRPSGKLKLFGHLFAGNRQLEFPSDQLTKSGQSFRRVEVRYKKGRLLRFFRLLLISLLHQRLLRRLQFLREIMRTPGLSFGASILFADSIKRQIGKHLKRLSVLSAIDFHSKKPTSLINRKKQPASLVTCNLQVVGQGPHVSL